MNIIDLCKIIYPGEIEKGNITFRKPETQILIDRWDVFEVEKPTEAELEARIPEYQQQININQLTQIAHDILNNIIEKTAVERGYLNALDCISYYSSSIVEKSNDAQAFINWRDSVWGVFSKVLTDFENGNIERPTRQEFIAMLPVINW